MTDPTRLLKRINEIGETLSKKSTALALIGLGSVGLELDRLDQFSDLDFFVIVEAGAQDEYLADLSWLTDIAPVAYHFKNTRDGFKLLYVDGIFCEFAVFDVAALENAEFSPGRIVWQAEGVDEAIALPMAERNMPPRPSAEWLLGEALTNLYVGLARDARGEKLSGMRFIQGHAVDRILELVDRLEPVSAAYNDPYDPNRRFEERYPGLAPRLPELIQGYERNRESARAALAFLDEHFEINPAMKQAVFELAQEEQKISDRRSE